MQAREVLVTGYGLVAPTALDAASLFTTISENRSCIRQHPAFVELGFANPVAGFIDEQQWQVIAAAFPGDLQTTSRQEWLAHYVARQALAHAGLADPAFARVASGIFVGANKYCMSGDLRDASRYMDDQGRVDLDQYLDNHTLSGGAFARRVDQQTRHLAEWLGVRDHISTHSDACAAGTMAIGSAYRAIARGEIDLALCGAVELMAHELSYYSFDGLGALCQRVDFSPQEQSRPFMPDRCGFVLSEGAALLVLESREHAERRQAHSLGRVLGYANLCEAEKITSSSRDGSKYAACMTAALADAELPSAAVDHVNVHGTSTQANDRCEALGLAQVFGETLEQMTFTANKSAVGHSLAGSGAIEAVLSLMSIQSGVALPTLNFQPEKSEFPELKFLCEPLQQPINVVLSNSFGFGGVNSSLVLGRA
ncbi:beta-ketoacyl-[acyl-carrier-protein] synthase family protein [Pseudomonas asiatica]|uniref:Beta-ketoacyl-[acyl-carrier-protein] synthase family protein n=1 Tax=Pseudomonas asiatica TaxID=2219225 RepID=A0ABU5KT11_9PSED|nr:beta-ketoacyl-[acyl-carrier-protein] synthase family protein [Pseudomonas asiatica]MDZ5737066.1 beta-ketoacyl-[acyl-carrier-protein] synthase family protein [Pseudomonas asiatica]MDZ5742256.1 beta-ketoacyl-[acyl-carrier-protein] synthase family protein [Pseudomonas asiatica]MDZ5747296.1 beta-ketoacyl-[acyl-carrier-protein] synthase family protein [Pseudomonas asiatica]MDZ5752412.1 beta-ketoacyl-[acyl-carrier-protein] synthase family protein [Pseudomonas asiatica]